MPPPMPPLNALRALEAAARYASFRKAALELNVSPAAISHQIKNLEAILGVQLFHRLSHGLRLTEAGQTALPLLSDGFAKLAEAVHLLRAPNQRESLTVLAPPSFASKWLLPRLHRYAAIQPEIDIRLSASSEMIDEGAAADGAEILSRDVDLTIHFGDGQYPGYRVDKLFDVSTLPLCSPKLMLGDHPLRSPDDLRFHTLLHDDTDYAGRPDWRTWLDAVRARGIDANRGPRFNHAAMALEAALEGQGVALSLEPLARADLAAGRLVAPFAFGLKLRAAYYAVSPEGRADDPEIAAFRRWLLDEAKSDEALRIAYASQPEAIIEHKLSASA